MKLEKTVHNYTIQVKRLHLPYRIDAKCPKCGEPYPNWITDFEHQCYFNYPKINEWEEHTLYCPECEHEQPIKLKINVSE